MPSTAYRYMNSSDSYAAKTMASKSAPLSYFAYTKYKTGSEARDAYQIFYEKGNVKSWSDARLLGEFDTLQLYKNGVPQVKVPLANGGMGLVMNYLQVLILNKGKVVLFSYCQLRKELL